MRQVTFETRRSPMAEQRAKAGLPALANLEGYANSYLAGVPWEVWQEDARLRAKGGGRLFVRVRGFDRSFDSDRPTLQLLSVLEAEHATYDGRDYDVQARMLMIAAAVSLKKEDEALSYSLLEGAEPVNGLRVLQPQRSMFTTEYCNVGYGSDGSLLNVAFEEGVEGRQMRIGPLLASAGEVLTAQGVTVEAALERTVGYLALGFPTHSYVG